MCSTCSGRAQKQLMLHLVGQRRFMLIMRTVSLVFRIAKPFNSRNFSFCSLSRSLCFGANDLTKVGLCYELDYLNSRSLAEEDLRLANYETILPLFSKCKGLNRFVRCPFSIV